MPTSAATPAASRAAQRLHDLRVKAACRVTRSVGDSTEIREDGLATFDALKDARDRANATIVKGDDPDSTG